MYGEREDLRDRRRTVLAHADADAKAAGLNRSELIEQALRNEHLRRALHNTKPIPRQHSASTPTPRRSTKPTRPPACDHPPATSRHAATAAANSMWQCCPTPFTSALRPDESSPARSSPAAYPTPPWPWSSPSSHPEGTLLPELVQWLPRVGTRRTDRLRRPGRPRRGGIHCGRADLIARPSTAWAGLTTCRDLGYARLSHRACQTLGDIVGHYRW